MRQCADRLEAAGEDGSKPGRLAQRKARDLSAALQQLDDLIASRGYQRHTEAEVRAEHTERAAALRRTADELDAQLAAGRQYEERAKEKERDREEDADHVADQRAELAAQDEGLDMLHDVIKRQRDITVTIFDQIDEQNMMLDELDDALENTGLGMGAATSRIQSFMLDTRDGAVCGMCVNIQERSGVSVLPMAWLGAACIDEVTSTSTSHRAGLVLVVLLVAVLIAVLVVLV
jgi:hypothetical protein